MGMTEKIVKINVYCNQFTETILDWDKYAFKDEKLFHKLLAERSACGFVGTFTVDGTELNKILDRKDFKDDDIFLILWDN